MKQLKKLLCVFLTVLFIFSAVSTGVTAFAADDDISEAYENLAYQFFYYTDGSKKIIERNPETGFIEPTILRDINQYTVHNEQGDFVYSDSRGLPIRLFKYNHVVTAKDDINRTIRNAANTFYNLLNIGGVMSKDYGVGNYTIDRIEKAVIKNLKAVKDGDGKYLFFDGKSYFTDAYGNLEEVSDFDTYFVDENNEVVFYNVYDAQNNKLSYNKSKPQVESVFDLIEKDDTSSALYNYRESVDGLSEYTLWDFMNVPTIINYFCGNCTSVNEGNWFHSFEFKCETDVDTVLSKDELVSSQIPLFSLSVKWENDRFYDESGTKPMYVNKGFTMTTNDTGISDIRADLCNLRDRIDGYIAEYYRIQDSDSNSIVLEKLTNKTLLESSYEEITQFYDVFSSISSNAKVNCFGDKAFTYMHLVSQLTPISVKTEYLPSRTSTEYKDASEQPVTYQVTVDKVSSVINIIDGLLSNKKVGNILKSFIKPGDTENFVGGAYYDDGIELLQELIKHLLYQDSIINLALTKLYPLVTDIIDEKLTDQFMHDTLYSIAGDAVGWALEGLLDAIVNEQDGWQATIYRVLADNHIALTPGGVAMIMYDFGYSTEFAGPYEYLKKCGDIAAVANPATGKSSNSYKADDGTSFNGVVGREGDAKMLGRWDDVNEDLLVWGVNGNAQNFKSALSAALCPLSGLLAAALGDVKDYTLTVGKIFGADLSAKISNAPGYEQILLPLLETLGATAEDGLVSPATFKSDAEKLKNKSSITAANVKKFISDIISPILGLVENKVIPNPIHWVMELIPNVSYYLTSGALLASIMGFELDIGVLWDALIPISKHDIYTLNVGELIEDEVAFLTSLDNVLKLISLGGETGNPYIGYSLTYKTSSGMTIEDTTVYKTKEQAQDAYRHISDKKDGSAEYTPLISCYSNDAGTVLSTVMSSDTPKVYSGLDKNGDIIYDRCVLNQVGYANAAGNVITSKELAEYSADEYNRAVTSYYSYYKYTLTVTDEETGKTTSSVVTSPKKPDDGIAYELIRTLAKPEDGINYEFIVEPEMETAEVALPPLMDYKLQATGTLKTISSLRTTSVSTTDGGWAANQRKYIDMHLHNPETGRDEDSVGFVIMYVFRYAFSSIAMKSYNAEEGSFSEMSLLDSFGLGDTLNDDLFAGLRLADIVNNVTLNPDGAIAALWELFQKNEFGSLYVYNENTKTVEKGPRYTYYMEPVDYRAESIKPYLNKDRTFGTGARYSEYWTAEDSQYVIGNLDTIAKAVFGMLKIENTQNLSDFIQGYIDQYVCNDEVVSNVTRRLCEFLSGINLEDVIKNALGVDYSKQIIVDILKSKFGDEYEPAVLLETDIARKTQQFVKEGMDYSEAYQKALYTFDKDTFYVDAKEDIPCDWGFNDPDVLAVVGGNKLELILTLFCSVMSPFSFIIKYLFLDEDITVFDLVTIPTYAGYYYAWGPLMEGFSAMDLISYKSYYNYVYNTEIPEYERNYNCLYYFAKPLISLVNDIVANPLETVLSLIPNLLYFINNGAFFDVINNLIHFVYVIIDMLTPIYDIKGLANKFLGNLEVEGIKLNLELPLDVDVNSLINTALDSLLGGLFPIEIENKNIVVGTHIEKQQQAKRDAEGNIIYQVDEFGEPVLDKDGKEVPVLETVDVEVEEYQISHLDIELPYFDLSSLCVGKMQLYRSPTTEMENAVRLASVSDVEFDEEQSTLTSSGTDLITYILRFVFDTLLLEGNTQNIEKFLCEFTDLNSDDAQTLDEVLTALRGLAVEYNVIDRVMGAVLKLLKLLIPIVDTIGARFEKVNFSITDLIDSTSNIEQLLIYVKALMNAGDNNNPEVTETLTGFAKIISKLADFFKNLINFFKSLFTGMKA